WKAARTRTLESVRYVTQPFQAAGWRSFPAPQRAPACCGARWYSHHAPPPPAGRIQDWSANSHVRAFLAADQGWADKAVRAPLSSFLEFSLRLHRERVRGGGCPRLGRNERECGDACGEEFSAQARRERRALACAGAQGEEMRQDC